MVGRESTTSDGMISAGGRRAADNVPLYPPKRSIMGNSPKGSVGQRWYVKARKVDPPSALAAQGGAPVVVLKEWNDDEQTWSVKVEQTNADAEVKLVDLWKPAR
jgi:hypothetical protein